MTSFRIHQKDLEQNIRTINSQINTLVSEISDGSDIYYEDLGDIPDNYVMNQTNCRKLFITDSGKYEFFFSINTMFVTLVAGGSASRKGIIENGLFKASAGGSAGGSFSMIPIPILDPSASVSILANVGMGGIVNDETDAYIDGTDTTLTILINGVEYTTLKVTGGKGSNVETPEIAGEPGIGNENFNGGRGQNGTVVLSSQIAVAGKGGDSLLAPGGKGYMLGQNDVTLSQGIFGSGAGGQIPGAEFYNSGGDGCIIIEYF